ncbi:MAG: UDP-3-O-(3-hydroxymyristoyl)glucosamine N-acyltransferase [Phycisphaeraceae bacterium]|nr:MAG: UDP-3-O-(3-hydroxymyristoyl)glucosamine N-acyltransferase [Phycisphaeraceae bacterium]
MPVQTDNNAIALTTGEMAERLGAELVGPADLTITRLDSLDRADEATLTFIRDARNASRWSASRAGAAIVTRGVELDATDDEARRALLYVEDADLALIGVLELFAPAHVRPAERHPSAAVDATAHVDPGAFLGPGVAVGPRTRIEAGAALHANVTLGADVVIGAGSDIRAGVVIEDRCVIGRRVIIHPNAVIGADGFGYRPAPKGDNGGPGLLKIPHAGAVEIGDDVEIGSCTTIDRGKFGSTVIGAGTKIDNLVQIGHNCRIGRCCIICGAAGVSGSVTIGDGATLGGGVGIKDNLTIGAGASIGARAALMDDVPPGEAWAGYPAAPIRETMRIVAATRRLPDLLKRLSRQTGDDRA